MRLIHPPNGERGLSIIALLAFLLDDVCCRPFRLADIRGMSDVEDLQGAVPTCTRPIPNHVKNSIETSVAQIPISLAFWCF